MMDQSYAQHMAFNDNAFVNDIWNCRVSKADYAKYHSHLYFIYLAMENASKRWTDNPYFKLLYNDQQQRFLIRVPSLERDLQYYYGDNWKSQISPSSITRKYVNIIEEAASDPLRLLMHQFQRYLADLSGGATLRVKLTENFKLKHNRGVEFYVFDGKAAGIKLSNGQYVEQYLNALDKIGVDLSQSQKEMMLRECTLIYRINHDLYNEMTPNAKPTPFESSDELENVISESSKSGKSSNSSTSTSSQGRDRSFTLEQIQQCDGVKSDTILISLDGAVYDCTKAASSYGPGGSYALFAGHDITYSLAINSLKKEDVDTFGVEFDEKQRKRIKGWTDYFLKNYKLIGRLAMNEGPSNGNDRKLFKLEELKKYNGKDKGDLVYLCVDGVVFDVTKGREYYGPGGGYSMFAGNDITYNLAINSLKKEDLNTFQFDLTPKQVKALKKWKEFYTKTYTKVGRLNKFYWKSSGNKGLKGPRPSKL